MMPIQREFATLVPILLTLLAGACGTQDNAGDPLTFTDPAGYSITVPSGWTVVERPDPDALIRADIYRDEEMGLQVRLSDVEPSSFRSTAEALITDYSMDIASRWGGHCGEVERSFPQAGTQSLTTRFQAEYGDGSSWYLQLSLVNRGSMLLILQCGCPWEDRLEGQAAFDGMVESVSFGQ